jgi:hypothetical protein
MDKRYQLRTALLWAAVAGFSSQSSAFIDPEEWKMDKWGKWDEWDGPPDMKKWRTDQWGDMDQWGMMPDSERRLPWEIRSGQMPWRGDRGNWGGMPWGGDRGGWGNMPWGGNSGYGTPPWGGNNRWGGMPWGGAPWGGGPQSGWNRPPHYGPQQQPGWGRPGAGQQYRQPEPQPYRTEPGRYPVRPQGTSPTAETGTAADAQ